MAIQGTQVKEEEEEDERNGVIRHKETQSA